MPKQTIKSKYNRRKNPLYNKPQKPIRPRTVFDGQVLNHKNIYAPLTTSSNVIGQFIPIDATGSGSAMGSSGAAIADHYSQYVFRSMVMRWLPYVGPANVDAGSRVFVCYFDSPENMVSYIGSGDAAQIAAIKTARNMKSFNAWEQFTYVVPLTRRRKIFSVDLNSGLTSNELDRGTQGILAYGAESASAAVSLGCWQAEIVVELRSFRDIST